MSIQKKSETEKVIEKKLEERGIGLSPEEACKRISKKASTTAIVTLIILLGTTIPLGIGLSYGMDSIIDITINMDGMMVTPNSTIKVDIDKPQFELPPIIKEASSENATFSPYCICISLLSPVTLRWFGNEYTFAQVPTRMVDRGLYSDVASLENYEDYYVGGSSYFTYLDKNMTYNVQMRTSSDYYLMVKIIMYVNFTDPSISDRYISFVYSENHGVTDLRGRSLGKTAFPLERGKTCFLNLTGFYYDYQYINDFFRPWATTSDVPIYPFILNGTRDVRFDWNNFWRVHD